MDNSYKEDALKLAIKHAGRELLSDAALRAETEFNGGFGFSGGFEKNMKKLINADIRRRRAKKAGRIALRVAAVFLVLIIVSTVAILSSEALRVKVYNLFFSVGDKSTDINFQEKNPDEMDSPGTEEFILPGYLPEGFILKNSQKTGDMYFSEYRDSSDGYLIIDQAPVDGSLSIDSQGEASYKTTVNNRETFVFIDTDKCVLAFCDDKYSYTITGNVESSELIRVAESMPV